MKFITRSSLSFLYSYALEELDKLIDSVISLILLSTKLKPKGCLGKLFSKK
jgi:hypothetical protein